MDIYQILTEYNNPWSPREILCFSCIMVIAVIMMIYLICKEKSCKSYYRYEQRMGRFDFFEARKKKRRGTHAE